MDPRWLCCEYNMNFITLVYHLILSFKYMVCGDHVTGSGDNKQLTNVSEHHEPWLDLGMDMG